PRTCGKPGSDGKAIGLGRKGNGEATCVATSSGEGEAAGIGTGHGDEPSRTPDGSIGRTVSSRQRAGQREFYHLEYDSQSEPWQLEGELGPISAAPTIAN